MFSTTIIVRDEVRALRPTCALLTDEGIYWPLTRYFRARNFSLSSERGYACAVMRIMNWTHATRPDFQSGNRDDEVYSAFLHALLRGTSAGEEDESGLWWRPATDDTVILTARRIEQFSEWLSSIGEDRAINPKERAATFCERLTQARAFAKKKSASPLAHAMSSARASEGFGTARAVSAPVRNQKRADSVVAFPDDRIDDLLWQGFEIARFKDDRRAWVRLNLRDILITLLCLYGGVRQSEAMHLWVDDVFEEPGDPSSCKVLIHSPESGACDYIDPLTGAKARTSRIDFLHRFCNQKRPLTLETGRRRAGWKGGLLTRQDRNAIQVFWIDPVAGRLFRRLWQLYIARVRPIQPQTPWAFLTKYGQPMGTAAYAESFKQAALKIGLAPSKWTGATPHSLRHRYGQWLNDLELSEKAGQLCLHHASIKSQQVYREPSIEKISAEIKKASEAARLPLFQTLNWSGHDK